MAPSKKRTVTERKPVEARHGGRDCPCLRRPHSDGICELNVWQGTTVDAPLAHDRGRRLLRPRLPVVKYKEMMLDTLSGHMYVMILLPWVPLLVLFAALYILVVGVFALLFAVCDTDLTVSDSKARDYFNMSIQTMATIGYGVLFPKDSCSNWVAVIESFVSMIVTSLMTGVAFVKFAKPRPHMIFSDVFTVSQCEHDGGLEVRFRVVNGTRRQLIMKGEILEVSFKLILMRIEEARNGQKKLCYYDLRLKITSYITLRLEAEVVHNIDEDSPFFGMTREDFEKSDFLIILMMSGVDETLHDMIHQQFEYTFEHMRWGAKFTPLLTWDRREMQIELDFDRISAIASAPISQVNGHNGDNNTAVIDIQGRNHETTLSTETQGNAEMVEELGDELDNVEDNEDETDNALRRLNGLVRSPPACDQSRRRIVDYTDLESMRSFRDDRQSVSRMQGGDSNGHEGDDEGDSGDEDDEERKSVASTSTNSGSENDERHEATPLHHVRFDSRSRTTSLRLPRMIRRRARTIESRIAGTTGGTVHHAHDFHIEQPMSLLRRRVRFKNHPLSRFSKGLYYRALETSWPRLFVYLAFIYFGAIAIIALLMDISSSQVLLQTGDVQVFNEYERIFFFCGQTISTIGYGVLGPNPQSDLVNFYVFLLAITGIVVSTLVTGLAWAKFSIPTASTVIFSDYLLLTAFHSHRAIIFRAANNRTFGAIIEGSFRVSVVILNQRLGHKETHELRLVRNVWPVVQLSTTVTHIIDENSPLYGISTDELLSGHHFFVVLFTGLDPVVGENMFSRKTYHSCDVLVGHHFVDNIKLSYDGVHVDLEAMNDTTLTPEIDLRESRLYANGIGATENDQAECKEQHQTSDQEYFDVITPRAANYVLM